MTRRILLAVLLMACTSTALARGHVFNYVQQGGNTVSVAGFTSTTKIQRSFPSSTVSVYVAGTSTLDTLYSDSAGTAKANPFTAGLDGSFSFYSDTTSVDITFSGTGITTGCGAAGQLPCISAFTWTSVLLSQDFITTISAKSTGAVGDGKTAADGNAQAANTTFTSASAGFVSADTGKTIVIFAAGNAAHTAYFTTTITFVNSTTVTLASAPVSTVSPAVFIWGTLDTTPLGTVFTAAHATVTQFIPTTGPYVGTETDVEFPAGIYLINNVVNVSPNPYLSVTSRGHAIIVQTDATKDVLKFSTAYRNTVSGLTFIGGRRGLVLQGANPDSSRVTVSECVFQGQTDWGTYINSNTSAVTTYSTGTVNVVKGSNSVTGVGTVWVDGTHAFLELHLIASDEYYKIVRVTAGGTLITSRAIKVTGNALSYEIGDFHSSYEAHIKDSHYLNVGGVLYSDNENTDFDNNWVELWGDTTSTAPYPMFQSHTAAFRTMYGVLTIHHMLGVPVMGVAGAGLIRNPRWIDTDGGNVTAEQNRFGGEQAGMMIVKSFCPVSDTFPYQVGCKIILRDNWQMYAGQGIDGAPDPNPSDVGILGLYANGQAAAARENVPQFFIYQGNAGHAATPIINNEIMTDATNTVEDCLSIDTATFFAAIPVSTERKFRYSLGPNDTGTSEVAVDGTWNAGTRASDFQRFIGAIPTTGSLVLSNNLAAGTCDTIRAFGVAGVSIDAGGVGNVGDMVLIGMPNNIAGVFGVTVKAWVSAANVISVQLCNPTTAAFVGGATGTVTLMVYKWKWFRD